MTSEIRTNSLKSRAGLSTVTLTDSGPMFSGITTFVDNSTFSVGTGGTIHAPATNTLNIGVNNTESLRIDSNSNLKVAGIVTATHFYGNGANLSGITQTTINNAADNRVVTATGSANTLNAESNVHIDGSGRLMVGTTTEGAVSANNFTIASSSYCGMTIRSGTSSEGNIFFSDATSGNGESVGMLRYEHANDAMVIKTANAERLRIDSSGRLLIGTTTEGSGGADELTIATSGDTGMTIRSGTSSAGGIYFSDGTSGGDEYRGVVSYNHASNFMRFYTDGTEKVRLTSNGNLGINRTTPVAPISARRTDAGGTGTSGVIAEFANSSGYGVWFGQSSASGASWGATTGDFYWNTGGLSSQVERLRIASDGDTTISASATANFMPGAALNVISDKNVNSGLDDKVNYHLALANPNNDTNEAIGIAFGITDTSTKVGAAIVHQRDAAGSQGHMKFYTRPSNAGPPVERVRIRANGDFHVDSSNASITAQPAFYVHRSSGCGSYRPHSGFPIHHFYSNAGGTFSLESYVNGDGSYTNLSDYRLKENIVSISNGIDIVKQLNPVKFDWKSSSKTKNDLGFIAHEVQTLIPTAVDGTKDQMKEDGSPFYQGIAQTKIIPYLTAALKEAITKIETLEQENIALRVRVTNLEGN